MTRRQTYLALFAILLLAACLRLYRLDALPPGLHYDEAFKGVVARQILAGADRSLFFRENFTEEPMMMYATALAFAFIGETPWAIRLVSALAGIATIAALYALARALFRSRALALLAAFGLAILYWHVNFSRLGMEPILTPLMLTLAMGFLIRSLREPLAHQRPGAAVGGRRSLVGFALAGVFLGATQYTYKAALFVPVLVAAWLGVETLADQTFWTRHGRGLVICALVAVLVFAPLGLYFAAHPGEFLERPSTVTATTSAASIAENALKVAGMFFVRGDENPRSNLPGRPTLDPFLALGFVAGLVACVARIHRTEARLLLLWLGVMTLPSVLTDYAPHFGRSIGATPAIALVVAYGFGAILQTLERRLPAADRRRVAAYCLLLAGLAFSTFATARDYFAVWGTRTGLFDSFDVGYLALAEKLRARPADETLYLSPVAEQHYTIQFGLAGRAARSFDGRRVLVVPPARPAAYGIVTREDARSLARLEAIFPEVRVVGTIRDYLGNPYAAIARVGGAPHLAPQVVVRARLDDAIELTGADVTREGKRILITAYWSCRAETRTDYTVFAHLVGARNPATGSPVWAQEDTRPGRGSYPTPRWRVGEIVIEEYQLTLPADLPRGEYTIEMGMYILETGARARVVDTRGAPMESDRVVLKRITLP